MTKVKSFSSNTDVVKIKDALETDGCVIINGLLSDTDLKQVRKDLARDFAKIPNCHGDFFGYETKRMSSLFKRSNVFQKMAIESVILEVMDHFLLKGCSQYQINLTQAISIGGGELPQIIHQDDPMFPFLHPDHEVMINCMWAIDDFTETNGATLVVPGSHLWPRSKVIDPETMRLPTENEIEKGIMKAGSVLIYLGSLYHSGGQNLTDTQRTGAVISYNLGWLKQAENSYLAYSKEEVALMPSRLQKLLGYFVHKPNLGCVDGQDPILLIRGEDVKDKAFEEFIPEEVAPILKEYRKNFLKAA